MIAPSKERNGHMSVSGVPQTCRPTCRLVLPGLILVLTLSVFSRRLAAEDNPGLMIELLPFDRVLLDAENDNTVIDVVLLDLPNRRVPILSP